MTSPSHLLEMLAELTGQPLDELAAAADRYPVAITPFIMRRLREGTYSAQALRQFLPTAEELVEAAGFSTDPTGETALRPARAVLRTYDNRVALMTTYQCMVYCRFCFRKSSVGFPANQISREDVEVALRYVQSHTEITDVLISGGDPLALPNARLIPLLTALDSFDHIGTVRIDSRALSVRPDRIDDDLLRFLETTDKVWFYAHMNHADDIDHPDVIDSVRRLLSVRVPVMNQCVLLAGVNDTVAALTKLMSTCYRHKVIPYNLYVLDHVEGAAHFDLQTEKIIELYEAISHLPGPAQPLLVYVDGYSRKHRTAYHSSTELRRFLTDRRSVEA